MLKKEANPLNPMPAQKLTVAILTKNNADSINRAIASVSWADEVILIDASTDETVILVEKLVPAKKLRVIRLAEEHDFAKLRNRALELAKYKWVLYLDADEEVSQNLKQEIETAIKDQETQGYSLSRQDFFLGRWLKFGETQNLLLLKLGRKNSGKWERRVHEVWRINGAVKTLKNPLLHYPHPTVGEFVARINRWTSLDAAEFYDSGGRSTFAKIIAYPAGKFLRNYFIKQGFRDGMPGLIFAVFMSFHSFLTRAKLYMLHQPGEQ